MRTLGLGKKSVRAGLVTVGLSAAILAGCARAEPHVYRAGEFDRRVLAKASGAVPGEIQVCYSAKGTAPDEVIRLAVDECGKYSKAPQFIRNEVISCPLSTPVSARYYCCPSPMQLTAGFQCSPNGNQVDWMTAEEMRRERIRLRTQPAPAKEQELNQ